MTGATLCRVARCPHAPVERGVCYRHRRTPDKVCKCGRPKRPVSAGCSRCYNARRAAERRTRATCACGKPKAADAKQCRACRTEEKTIRRCACGARRSSTRSRTCAACRLKAPTKVSKHRLDYIRAWRKQHPKGPPCVICGDRLSQPSQAKTLAPMCMGCRASTGQLARGLRAAKETP